MPVFRIMFLLAVLAFCVVWIRTEVDRSGREIGQLQNEVEIKESRNQYLKLEILRLSNPDTILPQAQQRFGLEPIHPSRVVVLDK